MFYAYKTIGSLVAPPGLLLVAAILLSFLILRTERKKIISSAMLLFGLIIWFMSTSAGSCLITGPLERRYLNSIPDTERPVAFLVLAGGSSYDRNGNAVMPGVYSLKRIYSAVMAADSSKDTLIFSGGNVYGYAQRTEAEIMEDCAKSIGWRGKTAIETSSKTTEENMLYSEKIISEKNFQDVVIVTSAFHMPRSILRAYSVFKEKRIFPLSGGFETTCRFRGFPDLLPDAHNFQVSCLGIKEWIGIFAFRILG